MEFKVWYTTKEIKKIIEPATQDIFLVIEKNKNIQIGQNLPHELLKQKEPVAKEPVNWNDFTLWDTLGYSRCW